MDERCLTENRADLRLRRLAQIAIMDKICAGASAMKTMSAKDAKNAFGMLIDSARAEPVTIEKHGRKVVVVMAVEEFERLKALEQTKTGDGNKTKEKG